LFDYGFQVRNLNENRDKEHLCGNLMGNSPHCLKIQDVHQLGLSTLERL